MKRIAFVLCVGLLVLASEAQAAPWTGLQRWFGIHYGPGIHAYNGCHGNYDYYLPEEVPPGEPVPNMSRQGTQRSASKYNQFYLPPMPGQHYGR